MIEKAFEFELGNMCYFIRLEVLSGKEKGCCKICKKPARSKKIVITELQECEIGVDLLRKTKLIAFIKKFLGDGDIMCEQCAKGELEYISGLLEPSSEC